VLLRLQRTASSASPGKTAISMSLEPDHSMSSWPLTRWEKFVWPRRPFPTASCSPAPSTTWLLWEKIAVSYFFKNRLPAKLELSLFLQ
jgi:hypothetical protein